MCGGLPPINLPAAFGGDIGSADGGRREADEDDAALTERMSPRSIMSDEVRLVNPASCVQWANGRRSQRHISHGNDGKSGA